MDKQKRKPIDLTPPGGGLLHRCTRKFAILISLLAALVVVGQPWIGSRVDEEIHAKLLQTIRDALPDAIVDVKSAERQGNRGILVTGLQIRLPLESAELGGERKSFASQPMIEIDHLELKGSTDYGTLLTDVPVFSDVVIRGGKLRVVRNADGEVNLERLLKHLSSSAESRAGMPTIRISDVDCLLADEQQLSHQELTLRLTDGVLVERERERAITEDGKSETRADLLQIRLQFETDLATGLEVQGAISLDDQPSLLTARLDGLMLDERLLNYLPVSLVDQLPPGLAIDGQAELAVQLRTQLMDLKSPHSEELDTTRWDYRWTAAGVLSNGLYSDRRLPTPITDISGTIIWQDGELHCDRMMGRFSNSPLTGNIHILPSGDSAAVKATLVAENLLVDEALARGLSGNGKLQSLSKVFDLYSPRGATGLKLTYDSTGLEPMTELSLDIHDMDVTYAKFPYPFHKISGRVIVRNRDVEVQGLEAYSHGQRFEIQGSLKDAMDFPTGWVQISADGAVPLDNELLRALKPETQQAIGVLRPTGLVWLKHLRYEYAGDKYNPQREIDIDVKSATVSYEQFPYPIHRIQGGIRLRDGVWKFEDFNGYKGNSYIQLQGQLEALAGNDQRLTIELTGTEVELDEELRTAFSVKNKNVTELWDQLQPQGALDHLTMKIEKYKSREKPSLYIRGKKWVPDDSFVRSRVQINPTWFPYSIDELTGEFIIQDGHVQLLDVRGKHAQTEFVFDAVSHFNADGGWDLGIEHLSVDRLGLDNDLLQALPASLSKGLKSIDLIGQLQLSGDMRFVKPKNAPLTSSWDLKISAGGVSLSCGPRFSGVYGSIAFDGVSDEKGFRTKAWLDVDSMIWGNEQLTKVSGPVWVDSKQLLVGRWAGLPEAKQQQVDSDANGVVRQPQQATQSLLSRTAGGLLGVDMQIQFVNQLRVESGVEGAISRPADRFLLQASLSGADLGYLARQHEIKERAGGKINGAVRLRGEVGDRSTWTGEGKVRLSDADIYELPLMVALLSNLGGNLGGNRERAAFSASEVDFRVQSERFILDRIALEGEAVSLYGNGWMSFDEELSLDFYSLVGRQRLAIPLINQVVAEASKGLLRIDVAGSLDKPRVNGTAFPELDGTMERILHDLNTRIARPLPNGGEPLLQLR